MTSRFSIAVLAIAALLLVSASAMAFDVVIGTSWDAVSLQDVLDAEYGVGAIDVSTDYIGASAGDPDPMYWMDEEIDGLIITEIAGYSESNTMGWYEETFSMPTIDGVDDGVIFSGPMSPGATASLVFPAGGTTFSFYMNPRGMLDSNNAPEPEIFFVNRFYNDIGPSGAGTLHEPTDGDPQCLVFDISHLRNGTPTFVLAWEDLDSGGEVTPSISSGTDNDFQDLVVEITALSPVPNEANSWGSVKALYGDR